MSIQSYNINYSNLKKYYLSIDEEYTINLYDKITKYINTKKIPLISKTKYIERVKQFNKYLINITKELYNKNESEWKKYVKNLMKLHDLEIDVFYLLFSLLKNNYEHIENDDFLYKNHMTGGFLSESLCDKIILATDVAGMLPAAGILIDAGGVALSLFCGDYFGAGLGLVSIVPVVGWASGGIEIIRGIAKMMGILGSPGSEGNEGESSGFLDSIMGDSSLLGKDKKGKSKKKVNDKNFDSYEYEYKDDEFYEYEYYDKDIYKYEFYDK